MQALCGLQGIFDLFNCKTPGCLVIPMEDNVEINGIRVTAGTQNY